MTSDEFRRLLLERTADEIVESVLLTDDPGPHTSREALGELEAKARTVFGLNDGHALSTVVVGSAKLGFAYLEKPARNGQGYRPAYRAYQPGSSAMHRT
jgi:hypothetical protein